jgi:hypothetical protein
MATLITVGLFFAIGGALNRLRGTKVKDKNKFTRFINNTNKWWFAVVYGVLQGFHDITYIGVDAVTHVPQYTASFSLALALLHASAMRVAYSFGWDVGPLYYDAPKENNNLLDGLDPDRFKDKPVLRCVYRLSLRGLLWGWLLALPLHSIFPILAGLLMGPVYWLCTRGTIGKLARKLYKNVDTHGLCEVVFGGLILVSAFI